MVTIRYFNSSVSKSHEVHEADDIKSFLIDKQFTRDELQSLRFFMGDILGEEIDTSNGDFLDLAHGDIEVFNNEHTPRGPETWIPIVISLIAAAASILMMPDMNVEAPNQSQRSATNSLGASSNEPMVNGRVDDIFGRVTKHTPPLVQVPYRIGVDNQETEVLLLRVGRGKYEINSDELYDGFTPYKNIPDAQATLYEPVSKVNLFDTPVPLIGNAIDEPIGVYRESNDLNPSELLPPNDLAIAGALWTVETFEGTGSPAPTLSKLTLSNAVDLGVDLTESFTIGEDTTLTDCSFASSLYTQLAYTYDEIDDEFDPFNLALMTTIDISGTHELEDVTTDSITVLTPSLPILASTPLINRQTTNYSYIATGDTEPTLVYGQQLKTDPQPYYGSIGSFPSIMTETNISYAPSIGEEFTGIIGDISIFSGATKVIVNITSASGFYKLVNSNETVIDAELEFTVDELDANGDKTGTSFTTPVNYNSNDKNVRHSVYQSVHINIPYAHSSISGVRLTYRDKRGGVSNVDKIEWTYLYSFEPIPANTDFGDVTMMHCIIPSNSQSRLVKARKTNMNLTRKITQCIDSVTFGTAEDFATDDFTQILIHTALDDKIGRLNTSQINIDNILATKSQVTSYFGDDEMIRFGYDFDSNEMSYEDTFTLIANTVNCIPFVQNGNYDIFFERTQPESSMQITCRNKHTDSETREDVFFKEYDGVELTYRDEITGVSETIYVPEDRTASNPDKQNVLGCVTELQATVRANRIRNKQRYHTTNVEFTTDEFGRLIIPYQRIDSPDSTRFVQHQGNTDGYNVYNGEIVEVNGLVVTLSEPVLFTVGEDHYIQFTNVEGDNSELILCTEGDNDFEIILDSSPSEPLYDGYVRDKTKFTFCSEQLRESIALIPQTIESKIDNGDEINTISSINYDLRYYQNDLDGV